jgi:hypothetical protein
VCGCDGALHESECEAARAGLDVASPDACREEAIALACDALCRWAPVCGGIPETDCAAVCAGALAECGGADAMRLVECARLSSCVDIERCVNDVTCVLGM